MRDVSPWGADAGTRRTIGAEAGGRFHHLVFKGVPSRKERRMMETLAPAKAEVPGQGRQDVAETGGREMEFVSGVLRLAGLDAAGYRESPLIRRIPACLRALKVETLEAAEKCLAEDPERAARAVNALLIGTTSFFRDEPVFRQLRGEVIPEILERRERPRVWSAACSEGAELYSVAMLFAEQGALGRCRFLGTDCREEAVRWAERGRYPAPVVTGGVPPELVRSYFLAEKGLYRVSPLLGDFVDWRVADVMESRPEERWDLILCRNLAIYLDPVTVRMLWENLAAALLPGGVLVVGKAEKVSLPGLVRLAPCIYRKPFSSL